MKKLLFILILGLLTAGNVYLPVQAGYFSEKKAEFIQNYQDKRAEKDIRKVLEKQNKFASKYNYKGLSTLYAPDFKSADGFTKDVYFSLIKETWESYPDIVYTIDIKNINVDKDKASADVYETSLATSTQVAEGVQIFGELHSYSNGTYYLKKINGKWLICSEKVNNEKSYLKYGDTRFINMELKSPEKVKPGEYYTSSLNIDLPENAFVIASIGRDVITYPQEKSEEIFRKLPDDNILERMFYANKDGKNEFNVASIGLSKSESAGVGKIRVYLAGIAFIMTRVNVENEVKDAEKD